MSDNPTKTEVEERCGETFYNCDDSTDGAPHVCDLVKTHQGEGVTEHHCKCGLWSDC